MNEVEEDVVLHINRDDADLMIAAIEEALSFIQTKEQLAGEPLDDAEVDVSDRLDHLSEELHHQVEASDAEAHELHSIFQGVQGSILEHFRRAIVLSP